MGRLDPMVHQEVRLQLMALLYRNRQASAAWLRDRLGLTAGNLGSHTARLAEAGYIEQGRVLTMRGFEVRCRITPAGDAAFRAYLAQLRALLAEEMDHPTPAGTEVA
jgi:DNA-binding MarR family transcriptional regulator